MAVFLWSCIATELAAWGVGAPIAISYMSATASHERELPPVTARLPGRI
jgi:hypothetical protein